MLDHRDDIDADFLAVYGIDLEEQEVPARRFIARTDRLPAYQSVLATRVAAEQQAEQPQQASGAEEMSVEQMNLLVPGLIETVEV